MFKRNQVEEAIALVFEPGSAKPTSELRTRLKRLLETDRGLDRNKRSADPERANFAFYSTDAPGRGVENWFSDYDAFALLTRPAADAARLATTIHGRRVAPSET